MAQEVKAGDTVKVHYHGRLSDGTTFDSSEGRTPLEFEVGSGMVIKGFDDGVLGMTVGQKKTIEIPVEDAYGPRDPQAIIEFPVDRFPPNIQPEVGMQLAMNNGAGQQIPVTIVTAPSSTSEEPAAAAEPPTVPPAAGCVSVAVGA